MKMQAVILAAGVGSRLEKMTGGLPKCLIPIGGRPIIEHQLEFLADAGIGRVLVIVGYKSDEIRKTLGNKVDYIENSRFSETNSLYSLWLARDWVKDPFVLLNSDLLFHPDILHRLLSRGGNALAFDSTSTRGLEQTKVAVMEGAVVDLGKDLQPELARGESLGLLCFDQKGSRALFSRAHALVQNKGEKSWVIEAVRSAATEVEIRAVNVAGLAWAELDFPIDLERANREVWPEILGGRWKKVVYWKRTKWLAAALLMAGLIYSGWTANYHLKPDVTWSVAQQTGGTQLALKLPKGKQKWWLLEKEQRHGVKIDGPARVRVESRLLSAGGAQKPGKYVLEVSIDGRPQFWETFRADPDPEAELPEEKFVISDRDRLEFELPDGAHLVEVRLLAGTSGKALLRIRHSEPAFPEDGKE